MAYAADKKPLELTALTTLASDDLIIVGDTSDATEVAKAITKANLITTLGVGSGDMEASTYDPTSIVGDAFDMDNMVEGTSLILSAAERVILGNTSNTNTGDQTDITAISSTKAQFDTAVSDGNILWDDELTSIADVKALDQSVVSGATPTFTNTNFTEAANKNYVTDAQQTVITNTSNTNSGDEVAADLTTAGVIEIATGAETNTGTDATRAVSPDGLDDWTGSAQITTIGTLAGDLNMGGNDITDTQRVIIDATPDADHSGTGLSTVTINAGATITAFTCLYLGSGGKWLIADASATATADKLLSIALEAGTDTNPIDVALPNSFVRDDTWTWTVGGAIYLSETTGALTQTAPTGVTDAVVKILGYAISADVMLFRPEMGVVLA